MARGIQEQKTNADAVAGVVTFSEDVREVEIFNSGTSTGVFTVHGFAITVPAGAGYRSRLGGDYGNTVEVTGTSSYEIRRID